MNYRLLRALPRTRSPLVAAIAAAALATSCGPPEACGPEAGAPSVAAGATRQSSPEIFEALSETTAAVFERGAQGGQHAWVQVRIQGVCPTDAQASVTFSVGGREFARGSNRRGDWAEVSGERGVYRTEAIQVFVGETPVFCDALRAHRVEVHVTVAGRDGMRELDATADLRDTSGVYCEPFDAGAPDGGSDAAGD